MQAWVAGVSIVMFGILITAVAANQHAAPARLLSSRWLLLLGNASFAIYILQTPVRYWVGRIFSGNLSIVGKLLYAPSLIILSVVVFLYFEEPIRKWIRNRATRRQSPRPTSPIWAQ